MRLLTCISKRSDGNGIKKERNGAGHDDNTYNPAFRRLRQESQECKASLGYTERLSAQKKKKKEKKRKRKKEKKSKGGWGGEMETLLRSFRTIGVISHEDRV
jgi:hypothetical protein